MRREEVAVAGPAVPARRGATRPLQDELPAHELAVIFADRTLGRLEAGVSEECTCGPFPDVTENVAGRLGQDGPGLVKLIAKVGVGGLGKAFPLGFGRQ